LNIHQPSWRHSLFALEKIEKKNGEEGLVLRVITLSVLRHQRGKRGKGRGGRNPLKLRASSVEVS